MIAYQTPILQDATRTGKAKYWQGFVEVQGSDAWTYTEYWQEGSERQRSAFKVVSPKNVGRKNATTAPEQAVLELQALETKQRKKGYAEPGTKAELRTLPMLAHPYAAKQHLLTYPCYAQPKLDGVRALYDGTRFWSRKGEVFKEECVGHLHFPAFGRVWDGELMMDPPYGFQDISAYSKKARPDQERLYYVVFDVVAPDLPFCERYKLLETQKVFLAIEDYRAQGIETVTVDGDTAFRLYHQWNVTRGYEGTMLRTLDGPYVEKYRSPDLLKYKDFVEDDFLIVGFTDGEGKDAGAIKYVCQTPGGRTFEVVPNGSYEQRRRDFQHGHASVGKWLVVAYQNLSDDGIPRFPRGLGVREDR